MTGSVSAYTNLESLLLFQCLHAYGVAHSVFARISDLLKKTPDVTQDKSFQPARLTPDALRNFYLERLKRELELETDDGKDRDGHNGDAAGTTKRKRHSPTLPSVQETMQHQHLLPKLVTKLYASYRNEITEQICAEEERYDRLQREIASIERGDWDEQLRERRASKPPASASPSIPTESPHLAQKPLQPIPAPVQNGARSGSANANAPAQDSTAPVLNGQLSPSSRKKPPAKDQRQATSTPQPSSASPRLDQAQASGAQRLQQPPYTGNNGAPPPNYPPYPQGQQPPSVHYPPGPQSQSSQGPPYQPQPGHPYGVPGYGPLPGPAYHPNYPQQHPGSQSPGMQTPHQQQRGQHVYPGQPPHMHPPPQAGFMLPPFQVSPQIPPGVQHLTPAQQQYPVVSTPVSNRQQAPGPRTNVQTPSTGRPGLPPVHPLVTQVRQGYSTPVNNRSPQSALGTPVSVRSIWKRSSFVGSPKSPASPRPKVEPLDDVPDLEQSNPSPSKPKSQRKSRGKGREVDTPKISEKQSTPQDETPSEQKPSDEPEEQLWLEPETRSGRSRRKTLVKRKRPGSIASSRAGGSARDRSRSRSILSHTETVADNESQAGHQIKSERGTSVEVVEEETINTPSQISTRRRAAASHVQIPASRRKRTARDASLGEPEEHFSTPGPPKTIVAQRHFSRMCAPIMNDINSHKHASTFTTAVRAKDAEGYYDIIKRPTDLKSIQKAIAQGGKQVAAAATDTPVGSPGGGGGQVELPITLENIPPKAIVNAAQLEKELMRMFVNAVMFNPGEDGVVEDAREMFESVQRSVSSWRNVERSSGRTEVEDTPTAEDEDKPTASKRRKM
ncbi:hypothetical protein ACN47E_007783 [Coniothyrium glycines]